MKCGVITTIAFGTALLVAGMATAQGPGMRGQNCDGSGSMIGCRGGPFFDREKLIQELELTPEQETAMQEFRGRNMALRQKQRGIFAQRMELNHLLRAEVVDEEAIRAKAAELHSEMAGVQSERIENLIALRRTLNPDQFAKLMDKLASSFGAGAPGEGKPGMGMRGRWGDRGGSRP